MEENLKFKPPPMIDLGKVFDFIGFAAEPALKGEKVNIVTRAVLTSDEPLFYRYINQITNNFLKNIRISVEKISNFLIPIDGDLQAKLFVNDFVFTSKVMMKKACKKGDPVYNRDIADIKEFNIENVEFKEEEKVILCIKNGWKFGLFFDLDSNSLIKKLNCQNIWGIFIDYFSLRQHMTFLRQKATLKKFSQEVGFHLLKFSNQNLMNFVKNISLQKITNLLMMALLICLTQID